MADPQDSPSDRCIPSLNGESVILNLNRKFFDRTPTADTNKNIPARLASMGGYPERAHPRHADYSVKVDESVCSVRMPVTKDISEERLSDQIRSSCFRTVGTRDDISIFGVSIVKPFETIKIDGSIDILLQFIKVLRPDTLDDNAVHILGIEAKQRAESLDGNVL